MAKKKIARIRCDSLDEVTTILEKLSTAKKGSSGITINYSEEDSLEHLRNTLMMFAPTLDQITLERITTGSSSAQHPSNSLKEIAEVISCTLLQEHSTVINRELVKEEKNGV